MKLITYNILAEKHNTSHLSWRQRLSQIQEILSRDSADIICLQEVSLETVDEDFGEFLTRAGYNYSRHTLCKKWTNTIGNLTAWKNKFSGIGLGFTSGSLIVRVDGICIANVHLRAGYRTAAVTRTRQLKSILKFNPDIIAGDFNDDFAEGSIATMLSEYQRPRVINTVYVAGGYMKKYWAFDTCFSKFAIATDTNELCQPIPDEKNPSDHIPVVFTLDR